MKSANKVSIIHEGKEVDATEVFDRITSDTKILTEATGHIHSLTESHGKMICDLLEKNFEHSVTFTVKFKKLGAHKYKIETDIAYTVEKIKDSVDAEINVAQDELFKKE